MPTQGGSGIMDKVTPSKLTLAEEGENVEEVKETVTESGVSEPATSTTESPVETPAAGSTETKDVEGVRPALTGDYNPPQVNYDRNGPVLDYGNRVNSDNDLNYR